VTNIEADIGDPTLVSSEVHSTSLISDRSTTLGLRLVSFCFAFLKAVSVLASFMAIFYLFQTLALKEQTFLSVSLVLVSCLPILLYFALHIAHSLILRGYGFAVNGHQVTTNAIVGAIAIAALFILNYQLAMGPIFVLFLAWLTKFMVDWLDWNEATWAFTNTEILGVLMGRDRRGLDLVSEARGTHPVVEAMQGAGPFFALIFTSGFASGLVGGEILAPAAVLPLGLTAYWSVTAILSWQDTYRVNSELGTALRETTPNVDDTNDLPKSIWTGGLAVTKLSVTDADGTILMDDVNLNVAAGSMVGVVGGAGVGKSLLLQTLVAPLNLKNAIVSGSAWVDSKSIWRPLSESASCDAALVHENPIMLPMTGRENLSCFGHIKDHPRGEKLLEQFVFSGQTAQEILAVEDATLLPKSYRKILAFARVFAVGPKTYFFDQPETGLTDKMLSVFVSLLKAEVESGRSVVIATDERAILEQCDQLLVLENGRVVDFDTADAVRERMEAGWSRFVGAREFDTADNLENWMCSQFKRNGDEANRRRLTEISSELLAFICQTEGQDATKDLCFDFKHYKGHCVIKTKCEGGMITNTQFVRAEAEASNPSKKRMSPLARIMQLSEDVTCHVDGEFQIIEVKTRTYDPRLGKSDIS